MSKSDDQPKGSDSGIAKDLVYGGASAELVSQRADTRSAPPEVRSAATTKTTGTVKLRYAPREVQGVSLPRSTR